MKILLHTAEETELFGAELWQALPEKCLVFLKGELGAGKTTLVRGVLRAAGYKGVVKSPTYTLVEEYHLGKRDCFHFDLYRLKDPEELEWLGIRDYFQQNCLSFIEWPERGGDYLPEADVELTLQISVEGRELEISVLSEKLSNNIELNLKKQRYTVIS